MNIVAKNASTAKYFYPHIDYRSHPAFRDLDVLPYAHDASVDALISSIDGSIERINASRFSGTDEIDVVFDREVVVRIDALQKLLSNTITNQRVASWASRALQQVVKELRDQAHTANRRHGAEARVATTPAGEVVAKNLEIDGVHICRLDRKAHDKLLTMCAPFMEQLRERAKVRSGERIVHNFELYGGVGTELLGFFHREGVLDGLTGYVGSNVNFSGFALEYSYAKQNWWRGVYSDIGLADSKTTYMHYDKGCRDPKAIIALTDVTEENGPTGYVRGSHKEDRSVFLHFLIHELDYAFQADESQSLTTTNYRPRFANEQYRREMLLLPKALHGSSHFGDDISDETELSRELLSKEIRMTKDVGNCIVFDGNYGIHRGAIIRSGERFVFQVIFDIAPPLDFITRLKLRSRWLALKYLRGQR